MKDGIVNLAGDEISFGGFVTELFDHDGVTSLVVGKEGFFGASGVMIDDFLGKFEDVGGGAVILLEFDGGSAGEIAFKIENVGKISTTPRVNGLPIVANDADVAVGVDEEFDDLILDKISVLVFVD